MHSVRVTPDILLTSSGHKKNGVTHPEEMGTAQHPCLNRGGRIRVILISNQEG
jgi:hypothetical protein